jgi:hypothetical protein
MMVCWSVSNLMVSSMRPWLRGSRRTNIGRSVRSPGPSKGARLLYDQVTPGEGASDLGGLEDRWVTSVLDLGEHEREKLLTWVPVIKETIEKARQEADELAARLAGAERFSQISPTDPSNESRPGESASWTRQRHPWHLQPASMEV